MQLIRRDAEGDSRIEYSKTYYIPPIFCDIVCYIVCYFRFEMCSNEPQSPDTFRRRAKIATGSKPAESRQTGFPSVPFPRVCAYTCVRVCV